MDLVDLIREKRFLGQEFLTWLWFVSERGAGRVPIEGHGTVEIHFEERMVLETGLDLYRQTVTCQGRNLDLTEARAALREGKKVSQARLRVASADKEWRLTLSADGLDMTGVRLIGHRDPFEQGPEEQAGRLLDRLGLLKELTDLMDRLFAIFLAKRLDPDWPGQELAAIRRWLREA